MTNIPRIRKGLGHMTPQVWARMATTIERSEQTQLPGRPWRGVRATRWGIVVSSAAITSTSNRWTYSLRTAACATDGVTFSADSASEPLWTALNGLEASNTAGTCGLGIDLTALPGTYALVPIAAGAVVLCQHLAGVWVFVASNGIDGACT